MRTRGTWGRGVVGMGLVSRPGMVLGAAVVVFMGAGGPLEAQSLATAEVGIVAGVMDYDFRGEGTTPFGALRIRFPLGRHILVEPSVGYASYTADPDRVGEGTSLDVTLVMAEFQFQAQYHLGRLRPYAGLGVGGVVDLRDKRITDDFLVSTLSASAGVAADLGRGFSAMGEVRARGLDELEHSAMEYGLGLAVAF